MKAWIFTLGFLSVLVVAAAYIRQTKDVLRFHTKDTERRLVAALLQKVSQENSRRLTEFKYNNCGDPTKEVAIVTKLIIGPDPLTFPGTLFVDFAGTSKIVVPSPISILLLLQVKAGNTWVKIPCIGQIGSCTYEDICELLSQIPECPAPLVSAGIPCKCPFPQGAYNLSQASFEVDVPIFPPGNYHAVANITNNQNFVGCVELFLTFA